MSYNRISLNYLEEFTQGDKEQMKKFVQIFVTTAPALISQIEEGKGEKDADKVRSAAHTLKSQVIYMGMNSTREVILKLEELAKDGDTGSEFEQLAKQSIEELREGLGELERFLAS